MLPLAFTHYSLDKGIVGIFNFILCKVWVSIFTKSLCFENISLNTKDKLYE